MGELLYRSQAQNGQLFAEWELAKRELTEGFVLVTGGYDSKKQLTCAELYNPYTASLNRFLKLEITRSHHVAAYLSDNLYLLGGLKGKNQLNSTEVIDPVKHEFLEEGPEMNEKRFCFAALTVSNKLMVFGGHGLRSCEYLDPITKMWSPMANMNQIRSRHSGVEFDGRIYLIGGSVNCSQSSLVSILHPMNISWSAGPSLKQPRVNAAAAKLGNGIVVTGGFTSKIDALSSCEILDPRVGRWINIATMQQERSGHSLVNYKGKLLAMGGMDRDCFYVANVEEYDQRFDQWRFVEPLKVERSEFVGVFVP